LYTFVETKLFTRIASVYLSEEEYSKVQTKLSIDPGGIRIIYYVKRKDGVIWMLTIYAKNEATDIAPSILRKIREEIDG
jgi:mRNA-degrading endonuclease RelE of RelBE toxin-antitoxin system